VESSGKQLYREFCRTREKIRLFSKDWWLDVVAGDHWDVAIVEKKGRLIAAMPYTRQTIMGVPVLKMPKLTPWFDLWIDYPEGQKYSSRLSFEKKILDNLISQIPNVPRVHQKYVYSLTNWLPFYWRGFKQTTRYSYILPNLNDLDFLFADFRENIRREIRKAQKRLQVTEIENIDLFYDMNQKTFERQNKSISYSRLFLHEIDRACVQRKCRKIFIAKEEDTIHAALYLVWDSQSAYYLMGGADPTLRNSGASSLLMWHAIQHAASITRAFDFEGSMIEPIERFFRSFGALQTPYFSVARNRGLFKLIEAFVD